MYRALDDELAWLEKKCPAGRNTSRLKKVDLLGFKNNRTNCLRGAKSETRAKRANTMLTGCVGLNHTATDPTIMNAWIIRIVVVDLVEFALHWTAGLGCN
jgi:hypothetical protein